MLGEHPKAEAVTVLVVARAVRGTGERRSLVNHREEDVGLPHGVDTLAQREDALEPGTRVDAGARQRRAGPVRRLVVLHEHEVPELHETVAMRVVQWPAVRSECCTTVEVDLRARSARTGVPRLPEVVLVTEALDAFHRDADLLVPDGFGIIVALVDGDPETVAVEPEDLGDEFPGPRDRVLLEVVTEREVAEHLEEHEVPLGTADVVEVVVLAACAHALLDAHRTRVRSNLVAEEVGLERHHAGHREQEGGVVGNQARGRHNRVAVGCEVAAERLPQFVSRLEFLARRHEGLMLPVAVVRSGCNMTPRGPRLHGRVLHNAG